MKEFSQILHDATDLRARNAAKRLLIDSMYELVDNEDRYGVDLFLIHKGIHKANVEVEIKTNWSPKAKWGFENVNFLRRKEKYCTLDKPTLFIIFNRDLSQYLTINSNIIFSCPLAEVSNKFNESGELFRKVPNNACKFNKIYASVEDILK